MTYFPFHEYWSFYIGFSAFILALLALDLGVFHKKNTEISFKEASFWTVFWIATAAVFNVAFYYYSLWKFNSDPSLLAASGLTSNELSKQLSLEFLTGFVVEKSLAIDNIFIFAMVFSYFAIPKIYQHRILFWGIIGALVFRAIFIALGSVLMQYKMIVVFFGVLLILTGIKMMFANSNAQTLENNFIVKLLNRFFKVHNKIEGDKFFHYKDGVRYVTPLFLALVFIELSDIIFAVDSVPAIYSLTNESLIVFTSNIFAILGLRSMYFMLAGVMDKFLYIKYGLAAVLVFVGSKMTFLNEMFGGKFPIIWSLSIIASLIGGSIAFSVWKAKQLNNELN